MTARTSKGNFTTWADPVQRRGKVEATIQRTFVQMLKMHGGAVEGLSIPNEGRRSKSHTAELKRMGMRPGAADFLCLWSVDGVPTGAFIEFKAPEGYQDKNQKAFQAAVGSIGWPYAVCRSWEDAWRFLEARGAPLARVVRDGRLVLPETWQEAAE